MPWRGAVRTSAWVALLLALGSATSALVAWGCFFARASCGVQVAAGGCLSTQSFMPWMTPGTENFWKKNRLPTVSPQPIEPDFGWARDGVKRLSDASNSGTGFIVLVGAGWPAVCLTAREYAESGPWDFLSEKRGWLNLRPIDPRLGEVPARPWWPGLALNTALYAALWLGALRLIGFGRAGARRRRGLCPKCAYDFHRDFASGCPECEWKRDHAKGAQA